MYYRHIFLNRIFSNFFNLKAPWLIFVFCLPCQRKNNNKKKIWHFLVKFFIYLGLFNYVLLIWKSVSIRCNWIKNYCLGEPQFKKCKSEFKYFSESWKRFKVRWRLRVGGHNVDTRSVEAVDWVSRPSDPSSDPALLRNTTSGLEGGHRRHQEVERPMEKLVEESKEFRVDQKSEHEGGRPVRVLGPEDELPAAGGAEHP